MVQKDFSFDSSSGSGDGDVPSVAWGKARDNFDELYSSWPTKNSSHDFASTAAGSLNPFTPDSGNATIVTGTGINDAFVHADGYWSSTDNTYLYINGGSPVHRVEVTFRGTYAVIALCAAGNADDMVHVEFNSSAGTTISFWQTAVGTALTPDFVKGLVLNGNLNDGNDHTLVVEVRDDFCSVWSDGVLRAVAYDPAFSSVIGNWFYTQARPATGSAKYYTLASYGGAVADRGVKTGHVDAGTVRSRASYVGNSEDASWSPSGVFYVYADNNPVIIANSGTNSLIVHNVTASGTHAAVIAKNHFDHELSLLAKVAATAAVSWQGREYITIGNGSTAPITFPLRSTFSNAEVNMTALATTDPAVAGRLWNDAGTLKVSAG